MFCVDLSGENTTQTPPEDVGPSPGTSTAMTGQNTANTHGAGAMQMGPMQIDIAYVRNFMAMMASMTDQAKGKKKRPAHELSSSEEDSGDETDSEESQNDTAQNDDDPLEKLGKCNFLVQNKCIDLPISYYLIQCVEMVGNLPCNVIAGTVLDRGQHSAPLTDSARLDKLLHEYKEFFEGDETFGLPLQTDLAGLIDKALRRKPSDEKLKKLMATYKIPENIPCLNVLHGNQQRSSTGTSQGSKHTEY